VTDYCKVFKLRYNGYAGSNIATVSYTSSTNHITNPIITLSDNVEVSFSNDTLAKSLIAN